MTSYSEGETVVITIAAACTIVLNEQFKTQKKKKKKIWVTPWLLEIFLHEFYIFQLSHSIALLPPPTEQ